MRGVLDTPSGCGFLSCRRIPGVRKKRVPLANFRAPLRGALVRLRDAQNGETSWRRLRFKTDFQNRPVFPRRIRNSERHPIQPRIYVYNVLMGA